MTKFVALTAAIAAFGFVGSASAADMPVKAPVYKAPPPVVVPYNWTGLYVGANIGYGWGSSDVNEWCFDCVPNQLFPQGTFKPKGIVGGGQVGYNLQFGNLVLGAEADFDGSGIKASGLGLNNGYISTIDYHWLSTVRGRIGGAFDRILVFATGGAAFAGIEHSSLNPQGAPATTSTRTGWTIGGGVEYAVDHNWSVKAEYLYADFGTIRLHGIFTPVRPIYFDYHDKLNVFRVGVNYKF